MELHNDACPCGHGWGEHSLTAGCTAGWEFSAEGIATADGCMCQLAHTEKSNDDLR